MHVFDQTILGIMILALLGALVAVKRLATGAVLDKLSGDLPVRFINGFNLFCLLAVNPLAALLFITGRWSMVDSSLIPVPAPWLLASMEIFGLAVYVMGFVLMAWALIGLGRNYQLGGSAPRPEDTMVVKGPFRLVRHPMYAAALCISLGLACLTQSAALFVVFSIYLVLIISLIPYEEDRLLKAYGRLYIPYRQKVKKLIPFVY